MARRNLTALFVLGLLGILVGLLWWIPVRAARLYGPPSSRLDAFDKLDLAARLLWYGGQLSQPLDRNGAVQSFFVEPGEGVPSIAVRLEEVGLIRNASAFRDYLVYSGLDTTLQAGTYQLSPGLSIVDIAHELQDATPEQVTFVILAGWRLEEIAASLPTSGLQISPDDFLTVARKTPTDLEFLSASGSSEGFLLPETYILPRDSNAEDLLDEFTRAFAQHLTNDIHEGFSRQGLDVFQAVTLASLVQREAVVPEEQPQIASVFYNRLRQGMKLDSDPTVQYALGYDPVQASWWTNPLSADDLQIDSPYNTYLYPGLPPGPIANPSLSALRAVAFPAVTPYYYFRARCDGSGTHVFAVTFEEHLQNGCQ